MTKMTTVKSAPAEETVADHQEELDKASEEGSTEFQEPNPTTVEPTQTENTAKPVFEEIEGMDQNSAISVLIQTAELAQKAGILTMRDSVVLAKAISLFVPGKL